MSGRPILVTGGTGFIGRHLVRRLVDDGRSVTLLTRPSAAVPDPLPDGVEQVVCSDFGRAGLHSALAGRDFGVILQLASYGVAPGDREIAPMLTINAMLPALLVELAAARNAGVVLVGSSAEYAPPVAQTPLTEDSPIEYSKLYGGSKAAGGLLAASVAHQLGVGVSLLRLFNVYGPGEACHRLLPTLTKGLQAGERVALSAGTQVRDFVHVTDAVEAIVRAGDSLVDPGTSGGVSIFNVCTGTGSTVREFAHAICEALRAQAELLGFGDIPMRNDDIPWLVGSPKRIERELGWKPTVDVKTGIHDAIRNLSNSGQGTCQIKTS